MRHWIPTFALLGVFSLSVPAQGAAPGGLMCELLGFPERTEITDPLPKFSWIPGEDQAAYQIRVAADSGETPWDSGKVDSDRSIAVTYAGKPLESHRSYSWKVRTWNKAGTAGEWSETQKFKTGPLGGYKTACYPLQQTEIAPSSVVEVEKGRYFIDFGRAAFAALRLTITSPQGGEKVMVRLGEVLSGPHSIDRKPGGSRRYHQAELTLKAGLQSYSVPLTEADARRMPPEIGPVMPFRYVEVENCPPPVTARQVMAHYPFNEDAAKFACSDKRLNDIWELSRYTMKATSFCGVFVDGDRERLPYEADAYINQLGYYCCDREFTLARSSYEHLLTHPTWPTEYKQLSIPMAWADYLHTGDRDSLAENYNLLKTEKLLANRARGDGLLDTKGLRDIVDWPKGERDGYVFTNVNTVVNAFHCKTLAQMADIAAALGKSDDAARFRIDAERATAAFNAKLFDPQTGLYVDGEGTRHSSLHANMFPLAFGLVPEQRKARVVEFVKSRGMACSVYGAQYLMEALFDAGLAEHAIALMTAKTDRSWAHMIYDMKTTIALEAWDDKYKPNQDWNHAWGAAPANIIPRKIMGIEPLEPGFRKIRIRPRPGNLEWAAIDLPTIRGTVHVDFKSSANRFVLNLQLPANTTAMVYVPQRGRKDGRFEVIESVGSGTHQFASEAAEE